MFLSYLELGDDVGGTEERRLLKGEHGVVALYAIVSLRGSCPTRGIQMVWRLTHVERRKLGAVRVESLVVVLGELLCFGGVSVSRLGARLQGEELTGDCVEV